MITRGQSLLCVCDHWTCGEVFNSTIRIDWKMWEIVFGVDRATVDRIYREHHESVVVVKDTFHFCERQRDFYEDLILGLIARAFHGEISEICTSAHLIEGLGCWITIIDIFGGRPVQNFQLQYGVFKEIYTIFSSLPFSRSCYLIGASTAERIRELRGLAG